MTLFLGYTCLSQTSRMVKKEENASAEESDNFGWDTEDELEIQSYSMASNSALAAPVSNGGEASSSNYCQSELFRELVGMGFPDKLVAKVIEENGEEKSELLVETLLTLSALEGTSEAVETAPTVQTLPKVDQSSPEDLENSPGETDQVDSDFWSSDYNEDIPDEISDSDTCWSGDEDTECLTGKDKTLKSLASMGYTLEEASLAMERCGPDASLLDLTDFISAAQMSRAQDAFFPEEEKPMINLFCEMGRHRKRKLLDRELKRKKLRGFEESDCIRLPKPMIGFGVPTEPCAPFSRNLPEAAIGPPYFYYENVALTPKGVWDTIKRFLYDVEPEFVDSKFFCAAARKRGYVHNLPIENRKPLLPLPPRTIQEAFPLSKRWWPAWDPRTKLNCLQTCIGSAKLTERIREALEEWEDVPPPSVQKYVLDQCRKWNLVWVGRNKLAPLECDEVEMLLGFPKNHTRGGGISRTDRYKSLGNSFQVDTVAYHLSVLKDLFPEGLNVLSLFSGIGGAEVALHRLGIRLRTVVSVEISKVNRDIVRSFWEQTNQTGTLIDFDDVQQLNGDKLEQIINSIGGFDLVIGGSPCNNLAGSNRHHRDGLEGKESALFYDYFRILDLVKCIMGKQQ